jgi:MFS transporter, NNP family, nitrate/nitrite transporter
VAFSTYLKDIYDFDLTAACTHTAGFAIAAVIARPVGGALSDRIGPRVVMGISLRGTAVMAIVLAFQPPLEIPAGAAFVAMAFFLALGAGAVFAWVALQAPKEQVGTVSGLVGAAGGLGGYLPPLVLGATHQSLPVGQVVLRGPVSSVSGGTRASGERGEWRWQPPGSTVVWRCQK